MIHAVIISGGWGKRFWPVSRRKTPKQLLNIGARFSSLENLLRMIRPQIPKERIWVVTNKQYAHLLRRHLSFLPRRNFLVEPLAKNTAAAVGLASVIIKEIDPQAVTIVLPSDHMLKDKKRFLDTINKASRQAKRDDALVAIGFRPRRAATEFGYIKLAKSEKRKAKNEKVYKVERFIEKPNLSKAKKYLQNKNYLWNSGIFVWQAATILRAIRKYLPRHYAGLERIKETFGSSQYQRQLIKEYKRFKDVSIDYGVMEKSRNVYTVAGDFSWADLGSWASLSAEFLTKDSQGNVVLGLHKGIDTFDSVIFSQGKHLIATLGLRDLVIVHTPSATLVCPKTQAQRVKELTGVLEKKKTLRKYL